MKTHPEQATVADDPKAREALRLAFENTARWPQGFKGFTAELTVNINGREFHGPVTVKGPREVSVQLSDGEVQKWAQDQLAMIAVHRGPRTFDESDGKYTLTMEEDGHPLGARLDIHGSHSFYRVKDHRITQINRTMSHPNMAPFAFTINVEESFTDTHARIGAADLPATRRIIAFENGSVVVKSFALSRHQLL